MKFYEKSFKERAVKLSYQRGSISIIAKELGISRSTLGKWRREYDNYENNSFPGKGKERLSDEGARIKELESQLLDKELDLEILKKAIAFFSRTDK